MEATILGGVARGPGPCIYGTDGDSPALSYNELLAFAEEDVPRLLQNAGLRSGDRVCLVLNNGPEAAVAFLSLAPYCTVVGP